MTTPTLKRLERVLRPPRTIVSGFWSRVSAGHEMRNSGSCLTDGVVPWPLVRAPMVEAPKEKPVVLPRALNVDHTRPRYNGGRLHGNSILVSPKPRRGPVYFVFPAAGTAGTAIGKQYSNYRIVWERNRGFLLHTYLSVETAKDSRLMIGRFGNDTSKVIGEMVREAKKTSLPGMEIEECPTPREVTKFKLALAREASREDDRGRIMSAFLRRNPELK